MFYKMIENKCTQWYESERCTVKNLIEYILELVDKHDSLKWYLDADEGKAL